MNRRAETNSNHRGLQRSHLRGRGSRAAASSTSWHNRKRRATKNEADESTPSSHLPKTETQQHRKSSTGRRILKKRNCSCCESTTIHESRPSTTPSTKATNDEDVVESSPQLLTKDGNQKDGKSRIGRRILKGRNCSCCEATTRYECQPSAIPRSKTSKDVANTVKPSPQLLPKASSLNDCKSRTGRRILKERNRNCCESTSHKRRPSTIQSTKATKDKADEVTTSPQLLPNVDSQKDCKLSTGRRIIKKRNCTCCESTTHHEHQPSTIQGTKASKDEADTVTPGLQLLSNVDSKKDRISSTGRRILKKRMCSCCESNTHHEHEYSAGQSTQGNYSRRAASCTARRRLVLDDDQNAAAHCGPGFSKSLSDNAAPEPHKKCNPAMGREDHASNTQLRTETRLMRSKRNHSIKSTSGPLSKAASWNTVSAKGRTPMLAFKEHVSTTPVKIPAGKQSRGRANAAPRKLAQSQSYATKEAASSKVCMSQNKVRSTKRQKSSSLSIQSAPKPKPTKRAGPSRPHGSKSSKSVSKPKKVVDDAKALQNVSVGAVARRQKRRPGAPFNETACDDMYEGERVAGVIPNHFFEQERWERLSDIASPITNTPPLNSPHLSPASVEFSYPDSDGMPSPVSRKNAVAIMRSMRKRGTEAGTSLYSTPKTVKHRNVKEALKGLHKLEQILKQDRMRKARQDVSDQSDDTELEEGLW
ncbi:hypothetical protein MTO96_005937 [Rhipicephalus appendiculatus]